MKSTLDCGEKLKAFRKDTSMLEAEETGDRSSFCDSEKPRYPRWDDQRLHNPVVRVSLSLDHLTEAAKIHTEEVAQRSVACAYK